MFQAYEYEYLGYDKIYDKKTKKNKRTGKESFLIKIIDTDFEETMKVAVREPHIGGGSWTVAGDAKGAVIAAIKIYSQRNLNVALNLVKLMFYIRDKYATNTNNRHSLSIQQQIEWYQYLPEYQPYHSEIEKLLVLV